MSSNSRIPLLLAVAGGLLLLAPAAHAQLEQKSPLRFNALFEEGGYVPAIGQFSGVGVSSSAANARTAAEVAAEAEAFATARAAVFESATTVEQIALGLDGLLGRTTTIKGFTSATYIKDDEFGAPVITTLQLRRGRLGNAFSSAVPRYYLGDRITPPLTSVDSLGEEIPAAGEGFWRAMPVRPGETFRNADDSALLDVAGNPVPQADGSAEGTLLPALAAGAYESFYYSTHADAVFASLAGTVEIWWVSNAQVNGRWQFRRESFTVSGAATAPVRKIYWNRGAFDGPKVDIPKGRIEMVKPIYTVNFPPRVSVDYDPNAEIQILKTLWHETNGVSQLDAYNREGRLLVEYLGELVVGAGSKRRFLGMDVVEVVRAAPTETVQIDLGKQVLPRDGSDSLIPSPNTTTMTSDLVSLTVAKDGTQRYYAEKESLNPDKVIFYWMEDSDAGIDLLAEGESPGLSIRWPKYKDRYRLVWPADLTDYAYISTDQKGSDASNGIVFEVGSTPQLIFQDDAAQGEALIDPFSQRFVVGLGYDRSNRSLLKFSNGHDVWYQVVYTQAENRLKYLEPDQGTPLVGTATVGSRIDKPAAKYETAGAVSGGRGYSADAYRDPYSVGVEAAAAGAIIPVNADPADNELTVRWFEKVEPPAELADAFTGFYVPSKVGRYTVSYPAELGPWQASGNLATSRMNHEGLLLADGRVLVIGGRDDENQALATAERFDPTQGDWQATGSMQVPRLEGFTATLLPGGNVLVTGGFITDGGSSDSGTATAEIYNPQLGTWTLASPMSESRANHQATLLADGRVLVCGGQKWMYGEPNSLASAEIYDPVENVWTSVAALEVARYGHTSTLLEDGRVLVAGGWMYGAPGAPGSHVEVFDPVAATWDVLPGMPEASAKHTATLLQDGRLLVVGNGGTGTSSSNWAAIYTPTVTDSTAWQIIAAPLISHNLHTATLLNDGTVLVCGVTNSDPVCSEIYDPVRGIWSLGEALQVPRAGHSATLLEDGRLLFAGGRAVVGGQTTAATELSAVRDQLVMASNLGTEGLTPDQSAGELYLQNNPAAIGFNPNEEHAVKKDGKFWALRDDLNVTAAGGYTSEPFVLVTYTDPADGRPAMRPYRVLRENHTHQFHYPWTAGRKIQGPMPLPLMQLPTRGGVIANTEVAGVPDPAAATDAPNVPAPGGAANYDAFTFEDRQGYKWVYRGPHTSGSPTLGMQWYYPMAADFYLPGMSQPAVGTALPYLRPLNDVGVPQGDAVAGTALTVSYAPAWPASVPSLQVAETLTLAKYGLPDVRNQKSAQILYQQSVANEGAVKRSVILHDPTRYKMVPLGSSSLKDKKIPESIRTSIYQGKTYFQGLPPDLQQRFFFDPLASEKGSLILKGEFHDEIAGDDYLDLNVLSSGDLDAIKALAENEDASTKSAWTQVIDNLTTLVETFIEDPTRKGTYIATSDTELTRYEGVTSLPEMLDADTARDSYALTATGRGDGYVTLMFGNGRNPDLTPAGDPPVMQIIKVVPELYSGDLKVRLSSNPLDEKVSLRHSGDFAARQQDYEFEWYWAPPSSDGTQPATYTYDNQTYLGNSETLESRQWRFIQSPASARPALADYPTELRTLPAPTMIKAPGYDATKQLPGIVFQTDRPVDYSAGIPAKITFSANLGARDGFVLYVNGSIAVVHGNGVAALDGLLAENTFDLRLQKATDLAALPIEGERLIVVAEVNNLLHFRIFDAAGTRVLETDESNLATKAGEIADLRARLNSLWATTNLLNSDKAAVVAATASIVNFDLSQDAASGLSASGLSKQFAVDGRYFVRGPNTLEVALYSSADAGVSSNIDFRLEGSTREDRVLASGSPWSKAIGSPELDNRATVGGSPTAPLGSPLLVMSDNFFTLRYRARAGTTAYALTEGAWTNWTRPALVEGWIKRVLAAINPFNQRMTDLYNNAVNTDVSLLTQAGTRWEGDIALTLDAINDYGLIEIYETVLKRGKGMSIGSGYDYGPANDALLLAAGYLSDLYSILGNEAFADAANPTVSLGDSGSASEVNTSRFCFEGQVASVLDEELALLRGRDDTLSPQVTQGPFYNRLFWNYTRGIDSGEAFYATNYNIKEKVGSSTEDGSIDAADAQRMFPQGHGDAYGHYLTALKGYYQLLTNPNFTWTPRTESLNILGNTVAVDYKDERKFAEAAANIARTAEQVVSLTFRQQYRDDPADGWESFRDGKENPNTGNTRRWGLDAWTSRANQGAYYHWAVGNAMLPDVDATKTGIQKIDRSTVPELQLLAVSGESLQTTLDKANSRLNPLGLSLGAIAFDISPAELKAGKSHYEQVYERSLRAALNAKGAFDQAAAMTRLLRNQENTIDDYNTTLEEQERAFNYQLIDLYGMPYPGDMGPGKTYGQGYAGPDLVNWFVVDKASGTPIDTQELTDFGEGGDSYQDFPYESGTGLMEVNTYGNEFDYQSIADLDLLDADLSSAPGTTLKFNNYSHEYTVLVRRESHVQFADEYWGDINKEGVVTKAADVGTRPQTGKLQNALLDAQDSWLALDGAIGNLSVNIAKLKDKKKVFDAMVTKLKLTKDAVATNQSKVNSYKQAILAVELVIQGVEQTDDLAQDIANALGVAPPQSVGFAIDATSGIRSGIKAAAAAIGGAKGIFKLGLAGTKGGLGYEVDQLGQELELKLMDIGAKQEELQAAYEYINDWRDVTNAQYGIAQLAIAHQRKLQNVVDLKTKGDRIQLEREIFRKRAATTVQGYRTNDLAFRAFRDESLEQYRTLFDLAGRYTYLAAKSYDYETGLLGTSEGEAVISKIVSSRALGDLTGGEPQATVSSLGDAGLAGTMAQLNADFSVAKGRLGINNPDINGTLISLRQELFRLLKSATTSEDDKAWRQTLEQHIVSNLMSDPDVAVLCRSLRKADGSAVPGIVIPFGSTIEPGKNFFGLPTAGGDHLFSASNFATKIYSVGVMFEGYVGMDPYAELNPGAGSADTNDPNVLSATPYVYLIPCGVDKMLAPALGDTGIERTWRVQDQALPLPYNLGATAFSSTQFFSADGSLSEQPWITRKHQAFRAVDDPAFFYGLQPAEFGSSRLVGRSVWNTQWKLVIPAYGLLNDEQEGLTRFAATVDDIKLFFRTYSHSGN